MARFNLFSYIKWKNDKHELLSNSSYKQFFDENFHVLEHYPWLNKYMSYESSFDLIKSTIIIKTILNKKQIEMYSQFYSEADLKIESTYNLVHSRLPYFIKDDIRIYVPIFKEMYNERYDRFLGSLLKLPYSSLKDDFEDRTIDCFDYYNCSLFNSSFTKMILISQRDNLQAYYDVELETIFIIDDQGVLEQEIPIFDNKCKDKRKSHIFDHVSSLVEAYYNCDKNAFILGLYNYGFISKKAYEFILKQERRNNR